MCIVNNIVINSFSIMVLSVIFVYSKKYSDQESVKNKIYNSVLILTGILLVLDILSRLDGHPDTIFPVINKAANFFVFIITPIISSLWILYIYYYLNPEKKLKTLVSITVSVVNILNFIMVIFSQWYGWLYYIDEANIYHRGPFYLVAVCFTFLQLIVAAVLIIINRDRIERKHYFALLFFAAPPVICIILQILFYGFSLVNNGVVLSLLSLFLYVQNQDVFTDHLTGIANRKKLDLYLMKMINSCTPNKSFSAIMIDLDYFKKINDTLGHKTGDEALQATAELLQSCIGKKDFLARYGGDEFCIVLNSSEADILKNVVDKINTCIKAYNTKDDLPYKLGLSMGYAVYEHWMKLDDFEHMIDMLMYEYKFKHKQNDYEREN